MVCLGTYGMYTYGMYTYGFSTEIFWRKFFDDFYNNFSDFSEEFFWPIFLTNEFFDEIFDEIFDEFFWRIFLSNFLTNYFDEFFDDFFFGRFFFTYNLLTIASFRIGVPSILFFHKRPNCHWPIPLKSHFRLEHSASWCAVRESLCSYWKYGVDMTINQLCVCIDKIISRSILWPLAVPCCSL